VSQKTGNGVDIQTIAQVGLGEVVAGSVRGAADICADICLGCSLLKNVFHGFFGHGVTSSGEEQVLVGNDFVSEILFFDPAVFQDCPLQIRGEGDVAFFVAFAMEKDHIVPDVFFQNVTHFGVSGTGVESDCQNQLVSGRKESGKVIDLKEGSNLLICESFNDDFALFLPADFGGGICGQIFLLHSVSEVGSYAAENGVDITGSQLFSDQILNVLLDVLGANSFQFFYFLLPFQPAEEEERTIVVPLDSPGREPAKLAFQLEFFQCVFCQHKKPPFHGVRKKVVL
jgi:hypothetical protein